MSENIIGAIGAEEVEEVAEAHFYESLLSRLTDIEHTELVFMLSDASHKFADVRHTLAKLSFQYEPFSATAETLWSVREEFFDAYIETQLLADGITV